MLGTFTERLHADSSDMKAPAGIQGGEVRVYEAADGEVRVMSGSIARRCR